MSLLRGGRTSPFKPVLNWRIQLLLGALTVVLITPVFAGAPPLSLAEAESLALADEPGQAAFLARADALAEEAVVAGQLPDPKLRLGLANYPIESGGFTSEGMTQAQLGIRQAFPPGRTRSLNSRQFQSLSAEMDRNAQARARDVLTSARTSWLDVYYWESAQAIISDTRPYFEDLATVTRSLYAVGKKDQQDVLRAELELSRLDDRLMDISRQRGRAQAMLSQWIGADAWRNTDQQLPGWESIPDLQLLKKEIPHHPAVLAANAKVDARAAGVRLAEEQYKPGWAVDLAYAYRDGLLPNGSPRSDFVSLSVTFDLPFFRENRQDRKFAAALAERRAATESREELLRRLNSQLDAEFARWRELTRRVELYEQQILVIAEDQSNAALAAYRSEAGDFADVMRAVIDKLNARLDLVRLKTERAQSYAVLANLGGFSR